MQIELSSKSIENAIWLQQQFALAMTTKAASQHTLNAIACESKQLAIVADCQQTANEK